MASSSSSQTYTCRECNTDLGLLAANLFPPGFRFDAGDKGTLSFSAVATPGGGSESKLRFEKEDKIRPFFETVDYWGIQRKRTKIKCGNCGLLVGHVYDDGPPMVEGPGQFHFGPSQVIPRAPRYRFKLKALRISDSEPTHVLKN